MIEDLFLFYVVLGGLLVTSHHFLFRDLLLHVFKGYSDLNIAIEKEKLEVEWEKVRQLRLIVESMGTKRNKESEPGRNEG